MIITASFFILVTLCCSLGKKWIHFVCVCVFVFKFRRWEMKANVIVSLQTWMFCSVRLMFHCIRFPFPFSLRIFTAHSSFIRLVMHKTPQSWWISKETKNRSSDESKMVIFNRIITIGKKQRSSVPQNWQSFCCSLSLLWIFFHFVNNNKKSLNLLDLHWNFGGKPVIVECTPNKLPFILFSNASISWNLRLFDIFNRFRLCPHLWESLIQSSNMDFRYDFCCDEPRRKWNIDHFFVGSSYRICLFSCFRCLGSCFFLLSHSIDCVFPLLISHWRFVCIPFHYTLNTQFRSYLWLFEADILM